VLNDFQQAIPQLQKMIITDLVEICRAKSNIY
jgi:hypothetical protein